MRFSRIALAALGFAVLIGGPAAHASWPWSASEPAKPAATNKAAQPSALSKMTSGTKNFFGGLFHDKKSDPKKVAATNSHPPVYTTPKKREPKKQSLLSSWFGPKETPPPNSTNEWMKLKPIRP